MTFPLLLRESIIVIEAAWRRRPRTPTTTMAGPVGPTNLLSSIVVVLMLELSTQLSVMLETTIMEATATRIVQMDTARPWWWWEINDGDRTPMITTTTTTTTATNSRRTQQQTRNEREVTAVDLGRTNGGATADGARNGLLRQEETTGKTTASTVTWEAYRAWVLPGAARLDLSTDACRQSTRTHLTA